MNGPSRTSFDIHLNRKTNEILIGIEDLLKALLASQNLLNEKLDRTLNVIASSALNTSPNITVGYTIGITPELLYRNDTSPVVTVNIANNDPAQPLWVGLETVSTNNGRIIQPRNNDNFVVPLGTALYAVTDVGTIAIVVSHLNSLYDILSRQV